MDCDSPVATFKRELCRAGGVGFFKCTNSAEFKSNEVSLEMATNFNSLVYRQWQALTALGYSCVIAKSACMVQLFVVFQEHYRFKGVKLCPVRVST